MSVIWTLVLQKKGNEHLYSDTFGRTKVLFKDDLKDLDTILGNAVFNKKVGISKTRKDDIKQFYYYETSLHSKTIYLNVAEEEFIDKKGKIHYHRFLYSVTDTIK